jgi:hypothetical protein
MRTFAALLGTAINITFRILSPYQRIIINSGRDLYTMLKSARVEIRYTLIKGKIRAMSEIDDCFGIN